MSIYHMEDGAVVKTENATAHWNEDKEFDGRNMISVATGSQWNHQTLYRSLKGRYWIEHHSQWQGSRDHASWITHREAAAWLMLNGHELPKDLKEYEDQVAE